MRKTILMTLILAGFTLLMGGCIPGTNQSEAPKNEQPQQKIAQEPPAQTTPEQPNKPTGKEKNPVVTIQMENGQEIKLELYPNVAPNTVNNFISLINKGLYNGTIFHRVIPNFMVQGGDPEGTGRGGPGYDIKGEFNNNGFTNNLKHERGVLSMARAMDPNSAGSQFFIMVDASPQLDGDYAAFGTVISGMEEVDRIVSQERNGDDRPLKEQKMKKVTVDTFGVKYPEPEKM